MIMASMKKRQEGNMISLWDEEGGEYDPEGVANDTQAQGEFPGDPRKSRKLWK